MIESRHGQILSLAIELDALEKQEQALVWLVRRTCDGNRETAQEELGKVQAVQALIRAELEALKSSSFNVMPVVLPPSV